MSNETTKPRVNGVTRRQFMQTSALLGGSGALASLATGCASAPRAEDWNYTLNDPENVIYSVCLQCHTDCPIKVKHEAGTISKIDGNPYSIQTFNPAIPYATAPASGALVDGAVCPKGQAGIQSQYDPYRVVKVLKRAGKRGANQWQVISFEKAVAEICSGGKLFAHVPGEEERHVPGLNEIRKMRDPQLAKAMAADAKKVATGELSVAAFKRRHRAHLDLLIDPDHPDLGPANNQFVFQGGRIEHGRKEFAKRWVNSAFGSINWFEHTSICEQSHHIAYFEVTTQYKGGKWTGGKHHMKPDLYQSEFVIFFGTGAFEANFGPPYLSNLVTNGQVDGKLRYAVVDPRLSKTAAKAWKWLPVQPGGDAALAYAMVRWMLENEAFDAGYLRAANRAAASAAGNPTWTDATWLVRIEEDGPGALLRAADIGLGDEHHFVTTRDGEPVILDTNDAAQAVTGDLWFSGEIGGIRVKSALQVVRDYAFSRSLKSWSKECGIPVADIIAVAKEFAAHGRKSVAEMYRGPVQRTNGYYNGQAVILLNMLVGNSSWKGGLSAGGGHWHEDGSKPGQPFPLTKGLHPGKLTPFGHRINREKAHYEESTLFRDNGYPAKRPWFPHSGNVYQEILPSIADGYPYPVKALLLHKATPAFSSPAGDKIIATLVDTEKLPLLLASDIVVGETSMYADYIFPDTSIWERWGTPHITPACPVRQSKVRQPTVEPLVETVSVFGRATPMGLEALMLALAEKLELPGYGKDGFAPGLDFTHPQDWFLKMVANLAAGDKPGQHVPAADAGEMTVFTQARAHLSATVFDRERAPASVTTTGGRNWWREVVYVLNRGGRYEDFSTYQKSGPLQPHPFRGMFHFYVERVAGSRHPYTGKRFSGIALAQPILGYNDKPVKQGNLPLRLITYKEIAGGQSRTVPDYWIGAVLDENRVLINSATAREMGLKPGQRVRLVSGSNKRGVWDLHNGREIPVVGRLQVMEGMRPGVVAVSWHYGHWAYGAGDLTIDGAHIAGDRRRAKGLCPNAVMLTDPTLGNVTLQDLIGGSASYYDTRVDLIPV